MVIILCSLPVHCFSYYCSSRKVHRMCRPRCTPFRGRHPVLLLTPQFRPFQKTYHHRADNSHSTRQRSLFLEQKMHFLPLQQMTQVTHSLLFHDHITVAIIIGIADCNCLYIMYENARLRLFVGFGEL